VPETKDNSAREGKQQFTGPGLCWRRPEAIYVKPKEPYLISELLWLYHRDREIPSRRVILEKTEHALRITHSEIFKKVKKQKKGKYT
jgi:hypothetical protein